MSLVGPIAAKKLQVRECSEVFSPQQNSLVIRSSRPRRRIPALRGTGLMEYRDVVRLDWFDSRKLNDLRPLLNVFGDVPGELRRRDRMHGQAQIGVFGLRRRRRKEGGDLLVKP